MSSTFNAPAWNRRSIPCRDLWLALVIAGCCTIPAAAVAPPLIEAQLQADAPSISITPMQPGDFAQQPPDTSHARFDLLPNWDGGRTADMLLPNYEPGTAQFLLLNQHAGNPKSSGALRLFDPRPTLPASSLTIQWTNEAPMVYRELLESRLQK
jgi:hypothetical protein